MPIIVPLFNAEKVLHPGDAPSLASDEPPAPLSPDLVRGSGRRPIDPQTWRSLATPGQAATAPIARGPRPPNAAYVAWLRLLKECAERTPPEVIVERYDPETMIDVRGAGRSLAPATTHPPGVALTCSPAAVVDKPDDAAAPEIDAA